MSMMMLCSDTCIHAAILSCMQMTFLVKAKDQPLGSTPAESTSPFAAAVYLPQGSYGRVRIGLNSHTTQDTSARETAIRLATGAAAHAQTSLASK